MQAIPSLFVAHSNLGGRGVFTSALIPKGSIIEICPVIALPIRERPYLDETGLYDYYFIWGEKENQCAIVLGYGSMYNHSFHPNAQYRPDYQGNTLDFFAMQDIKPGEEITVNYNGDPEVQEDVWFDVEEQ